jgi:hypothetical protein
MSTDTHEESIERTRERMRQSRAEVVAALSALKGRHSHAADGPFPRSALMRAATGHNGRLVLGGAALTLALLRPGLLPMAARVARFAPWIPLIRNVVNRYLVRRNARQSEQ